ncbi:fasciclin domain-containing protein [Euzebyella saccharophila]|uniref:Fasciclin domain-containing protein n=1 Tax=Euzebyella saccharophila TaxID=679664 RepID=A0ABV8JVX7_9FLAO|nr:fasciclin domain-containing protein [Euzebyella saccharophila]
MKLTVKSIIVVLLFAGVSVSAQSKIQENKNKSIVKTTASSDHHKTLLAAMRATDLEQLLDKSGPFTVFAPSDSAFENISGKSIEYLLDPQNRKELKELVTYHIVAGKLSASKILKAMCQGRGRATFTTVHGDKIVATMNGIDIVLTDSHGNKATIVVADSNQLNGVIHEIDSVIQPAYVRS